MYRAANSICIGTIGSAEGVSFGGVIKEIAPGVRSGVSAAAGASIPASGLIPANRLGGVIVAGFAVDFASGFGPEPPSEKPIQLELGAGGVAAGPVTREEVLRGVPFAMSGGGDFGPGTKGGRTALVAWSTGGSNIVGGGVGEGALALPSHFPNGVFGDAGRGLSEEGFSPLTSSSSPPDTGAFARGELRSGRVLGLPRLLLVELGDGDGVWEGEGSMAVGC